MDLPALGRFLRFAAKHRSPIRNRVGAVARFAYRQVHKRCIRGGFVTTWEGMQLEVPTDASSASAAYYIGRFDWWEFHFIERFLRKNDVVADVGANVGLYTLFLSRAVGPEGKVFAFEPDPVNTGRLARNISRNRLGNVERIVAAVGDKDGTVRFATGLDSVCKIEEGAGGQEVPLVRLDASCASRPPLFVKVDVEGFENLVLRGSTELMRSGAPIVWQLEFLRGNAQDSNAEAISILERNGYQFFEYLPETGQLCRADPLAPEGNNVLAIRDRVFVEQRLRNS